MHECFYKIEKWSSSIDFLSSKNLNIPFMLHISSYLFLIAMAQNQPTKMDSLRSNLEIIKDRKKSF